MKVQADRDGASFDVLKEYLRAELARADADQQAIFLTSEASFLTWAYKVLEKIAEELGVAIGYLVGMAARAYESLRKGFVSGFKNGFGKGRGKKPNE